MVVYKVFYKSYELRRGELIGILIERRKDLRRKMGLASGLRWARCSFAGQVKDRQAIFVVPRELGPRSVPQWAIEKALFTKGELLKIINWHDQGGKGEEGASSVVQRKPTL